MTVTRVLAVLRLNATLIFSFIIILIIIIMADICAAKLEVVTSCGGTIRSLGTVSACIVTMALSYIIFEIKRDIGRKSRFFHTSLHSTPPLEGPRRNIAIPFGIENLEWCGYSTVKKFEDMLSCFDRIPACNEQTDRHLATAQSALCI